jgi:hypothetical protein
MKIHAWEVGALHPLTTNFSYEQTQKLTPPGDFANLLNVEAADASVVKGPGLLKSTKQCPATH